MSNRSFFRPDPADKNEVFLFQRYGAWWFFRARFYWWSMPYLAKVFPHVIWGLLGVFLGVTPIYDYCRDEFESVSFKLRRLFGASDL